MDIDTQRYYHLQLAHDLILFMMHVQTDGYSKEQKTRRITMILEAWKKRVTTKVKKLNEENLKVMANESGDDLDVLNIISQVHSIETSAIREDFKNQVLENVLKQL